MVRIITIASLLIAWLAVAPASQAKGPPEGKGMGNVPELKMGSDAEEMAEQQAEEAKELKERKMEMQKKHERKMMQEQEKLNGLEKQQTKKAEQVQKELGKGSEKGEAMREEHRKKWWKFGFGKDDDVPAPVTE